jgi:hypothetical protein
VSDATRDGPVLISAGELVDVSTGVRVWCPVGIPFEGDGRDGDHGALGPPRFPTVVSGSAGRVLERPLRASDTLPGGPATRYRSGASPAVGPTPRAEGRGVAEGTWKRG